MTQLPETSREHIDEQAAAWCMALSEGELDADEQGVFDAWIATRDNASALEAAIRVWGAADQAMNMPELIRIRTNSLQHFRRVQRGRWSRRIGDPWRWPMAVGAAMLVLLLGVALLNDPAAIYRTGVGERRVATLDDGSRISLDANTEIEVRLGRDRRELSLRTGRAKFDVARDSRRPFSVTVGDKVVVATGTSFSVERLRQKARVLLYEGHVAVLNQQDDKPVPGTFANGATGPADSLLTPGHELVVALDAPIAQAVVAAVDPVRARSWEGGLLNFEDEPLPMAVERMNRYSKQKIVLDGEDTAKLRINGVFDAGDVDAFVEAVAISSDISVRHQASHVVLRSN